MSARARARALARAPARRPSSAASARSSPDAGWNWMRVLGDFHSGPLRVYVCDSGFFFVCVWFFYFVFVFVFLSHLGKPGRGERCDLNYVVTGKKSSSG